MGVLPVSASSLAFEIFLREFRRFRRYMRHFRPLKPCRQALRKALFPIRQQNRPHFASRYFASRHMTQRHARGDARFFVQGGCGRHKLLFVDFKGNNIGNRRAASRYGSGFVKHNGLGAAGLLKETAVLKSTPFLAPTPFPTIIATGVASPRAQGQLITRTEMALPTAKPKSRPIMPNGKGSKEQYL